MATRVPSRDSCNSDMTPGNREVTAAESTGIRAGSPEASSRITRTTLLPSATTHTESSSAHDGRVSVRASVARNPWPPIGPIHSDAPASGAATTDAASRPVREKAADR